LEKWVKSKSLEGYDGLALSIGVGEWPLIQQATLSIWKTQAEMIDYAYKIEKHKEVVRLENSNGTKKSCFADLFHHICRPMEW
jgi:hypothetical protein